MSVVPDSITPVIGWKTFSVRSGYLVSPQQFQSWAPGEKAQAACPVKSGEYRWTAVKKRDLVPPPPPTPKTMPQVFQAFTTAFTMASPPQPQTLLPDSLAWDLQWFDHPSHDAVQESCHCGIHIAKDVETALGYGDFLAQVAGWGRVIEGELGWRVQYAYPVAFYVDVWSKHDQMQDYGVPVMEGFTLNEKGLAVPRSVAGTFTTVAANMVVIGGLAIGLSYLFTQVI